MLSMKVVLVTVAVLVMYVKEGETQCAYCTSVPPYEADCSAAHLNDGVCRDDPNFYIDCYDYCA